MRRLALPLALALALAPTVLAAKKPPAANGSGPTLAQLTIKHETFVLPNGLTVIVHEDHSVPLVAVNTWYHVGSRDEKRGRTGFAHLFEHFFFNGSQNYPHGFREAMDDLGANNRNGTTNTDRTNFFEDVPTSALDRTLYLEADRMGFLAGNINAAMLERERGVVQNEKRQGENQPYGRVWDRISELMYPSSHPYSWSTIGSMDDLNAAKLEDIKEWYASYYGPNNAVLVLAGDITVEQARTLATKYYGAIPASPPLPRLKSWVPELSGNIRDTQQDRVPQARIHRVWHLPPGGDRVSHAMELFAGVLSGSESSPLDRRLVFDTQLATRVSAGVDDSEIAGLFFITVDVKPGADVAAAERELDAVLAATLARLATPAELDRARTREFADFARNIERLGGMGGRSDVLAASAVYQDDSTAYLKRLDDLKTLGAAEVQADARTWLGKPHLTLTVLPYPDFSTSKDTFDRKALAGPDRPAEGHLPGTAARDPGQWPEGRVARTPRRAPGQCRARHRCRRRLRWPGHRRHRALRPRRVAQGHDHARHLPARRRARCARRATRCRQHARPVDRATVGAASEPVRLAGPAGGRRAQPGLPRGHGRDPAQAAAGGNRAAAGQPDRGGAAGVAGADLWAGACVCESGGWVGARINSGVTVAGKLFPSGTLIGSSPAAPP